MNGVPYNNFIIGGNDPLLNMNKENLSMKILEYQRLLNLINNDLQSLQKQKLEQQECNLICLWDKINSEIDSLTDDLKQSIFLNQDYQEINNKILNLMQLLIIDMVKGSIENTADGKELLSKQYELVQKLKKDVVQKSDMEMLLFKRFREYSKENPGSTYEEFVKSI